MKQCLFTREEYWKCIAVIDHAESTCDYNENLDPQGSFTGQNALMLTNADLPKPWFVLSMCQSAHEKNVYLPAVLPKSVSALIVFSCREQNGNVVFPKVLPNSLKHVEIHFVSAKTVLPTHWSGNIYSLYLGTAGYTHLEDFVLRPYSGSRSYEGRIECRDVMCLSLGSYLDDPVELPESLEVLLLSGGIQVKSFPRKLRYLHVGTIPKPRTLDSAKYTFPTWSENLHTLVLDQYDDNMISVPKLFPSSLRNLTIHSFCSNLNGEFLNSLPLGIESLTIQGSTSDCPNYNNRKQYVNIILPVKLPESLRVLYVSMNTGSERVSVVLPNQLPDKLEVFIEGVNVRHHPSDEEKRDTVDSKYLQPKEFAH
eukprot:Nk52_evm4s7 gene=Nk52_evmTU4s7